MEARGWNPRDYAEACRLRRVARTVGGELRKALQRNSAEAFWRACGIDLAGRAGEHHSPGRTTDPMRMGSCKPVVKGLDGSPRGFGDDPSCGEGESMPCRFAGGLDLRSSVDDG